MKIQRKSVNNEQKTFTFDVNAREFLVKNLTDDDIMVCLGDSYSADNSILIPSYCSQIITENIREDTSDYLHNTLVVACNGEGSVEVQCLEY